MDQCGGTVEKLSLELGGNGPFIAVDDAPGVSRRA
jgi:acyl-CoA reductase-like NAD-dependent aldehyde dehydrogenase